MKIRIIALWKYTLLLHFLIGKTIESNHIVTPYSFSNSSSTDSLHWIHKGVGLSCITLWLFLICVFNFIWLLNLSPHYLQVIISVMHAFSVRLNLFFRTPSLDFIERFWWRQRKLDFILLRRVDWGTLGSLGLLRNICRKTLVLGLLVCLFKRSLV